MQQPSKVIHVRNIPPGTRSEDLLTVIAQFGRIEYVVIMSKLNQALIELESVERATAVLDYASTNPIYVNGRQVYVNYSKSMEINRGPVGDRGGGSAPPVDDGGDHSGSLLGAKGHTVVEQHGEHVLLVTIFNPIYTITVDILQKIFTPYGQVLRIVMFEKNGIQALVEMDSPEAANRALSGLNGKDIYDGCCTLKIIYSTIERLNVRENTDKAIDCTDPTIPTRRNAGFNAPPAGPGAAPSPAAAAASSGAAAPAGYEPSYGYQQGYDRGFQGSAAGGERCVLIVYKLHEQQMDCYHIFNLFCLYGNVVKVKLLSDKGKAGTALVQMQDQNQAHSARRYLDGALVFGERIEVDFSKHPFIADSRNPAFNEERPHSVDFISSSLNRFTRGRDPASYKHMYRPTNVVHFANAPSRLGSLEAMNELFASFSAESAVKIKVFDLPTRVDRLGNPQDVVVGLLEFPDVATATDSLILTNNVRVDNRTVRLAFSQNTVSDQAPHSHRDAGGDADDSHSHADDASDVVDQDHGVPVLMDDDSEMGVAGGDVE